MSESIRARMSSVSSTSCFTAVPIVVRLEAMKSASLPGSVMLAGERLQVVGQQRRERDDLLEVALDVALQRVDLEMIFVAQAFVGAATTAPRRYGRVCTMRSRRTRASPWTISRRLPSGSLNILWMWVAVPIG